MKNWNQKEVDILTSLDFRVDEYDANIQESEGILFLKKIDDNKVYGVIENNHGETLSEKKGTFEEVLEFFNYEF